MEWPRGPVDVLRREDPGKIIMTIRTNVTITTKCPTCGKRRRPASLTRNQCRPCVREYHHLWAKRNADKVKGHRDKYRERHHSRITAKERIAATKYRGANPHKIWAQNAAATALRLGFIKRESCLSCGFFDAEMRHPDYAFPLSVIWLCHPCYMHHHRLLRDGVLS